MNTQETMPLNPEPARVKAIFEEAIGLASPAEQLAYVKGACGADTLLLEGVQTLLRAHEECGGLTTRKGPVLRGEMAGRISMTGGMAAPGMVIGRYKLLQKIGEGGCGVVYLAEQEEPVRRRVALKVIKLGMDTREVIARFEAERQALAMMDHPNIAKVFDAGATDLGGPFFVMELVRGIKITDYCDQNNLTTSERLKLFAQVCHAVQHAHQKGIIHRDIKPSNVLVTVNDGAPVTKVIDFGIAKATLGPLTDRTVFTAFEQFIGTPAYMSPEQAEMSSLDIDTRSDIYSLGVLLYELLTGRTPFETRELMQAGLDAMRRHIREVEPPRPSTRLSTLEMATLSTTAQQRQTDPPKLINLLRGDLDWIVMRCLEKDRTRRYETASSLAQDLQRHLNHEPVVARPASAAYRFRKMVRRHRLAFASTAVVALTLVVAVVISTWQSVRAHRAERSSRREAERANVAERKAQSEAAIAKAVNDFLVDDLLLQADSNVQIDGGNPPNPDLKVRDALDRAAARVGKRFEDQPLTEAAVRYAIGAAYRGVGSYAEAARQHERGLELRRRELGDDHIDTLLSMAGLAWAQLRQGKHAESEALLGQALALSKRILGPEHPYTLGLMNSLALAHGFAGNHAKAAALNHETVELMKRVLGPEHPATLNTMANLASVYRKESRHAESAALLKETWEAQKRVLGPEHPSTVSTMWVLASVYAEQGKAAEAVDLHRQALEITRRTLGPEHPATFWIMNGLANAYNALGRTAEAVALHTETLALRKRVLGPDHPLTMGSLHNLGWAYLANGDTAKAAAVFQEGLAFARRVSGSEHLDTLAAMHALATVYTAMGKYAEATSLQAQKLEISRRVLGPEHPDTIGAMISLGVAYMGLHEYAKAEPVLREALMTREKNQPDDWQTFTVRSLLGGVLVGQTQCAEAEPLLLSGYEGLLQREGKMPPYAKSEIKSALERLVWLYDAWPESAKAAEWRQKLEEHLRAKPTKPAEKGGAK